MTATDRRVPFGVYVHVPFCASRCGYCAFNTYTVTELGSTRDLRGYVDAAIGELRMARRTIGDDRPVCTVFVGGGTPTTRLFASVITGNTSNGLLINSGSVISLGNNMIRGNAGNEVPSSTIGTQ